VQIGGTARRARIAAPVAIDAVAELAVRLFVKQAVAEGHILGGGGAEAEDGGRRGDDKFAGIHWRIPSSVFSYNPNTNSMVWLRMSNCHWRGALLRRGRRPQDRAARDIADDDHGATMLCCARASAPLLVRRGMRHRKGYRGTDR
jgi:hypothetical protein